VVTVVRDELGVLPHAPGIAEHRLRRQLLYADVNCQDDLLTYRNSPDGTPPLAPVGCGPRLNLHTVHSEIG
jgi:hypothetical protein